MDFAFSATQLTLRQDIIRFAQTELGSGVDRLDREEQFDPEGWAKCGAFGIFALPIPLEYGGSGSDPVTAAMAIEALAFGCRDNGLVFAICNHLFACASGILRFGTPWQKTHYLPCLASGARIGAHAMTESSSGSDTNSISTAAVRHGDSYVLQGGKAYVTNGPIANVFLVFARTSSTSGARSLSAFMVEKDAPGLRVGPPLPKLGLRTALVSEVYFEQCEVPEKQRLGRDGDGALVFAVTAELERLYLSAAHIGAMKRQLETCVDYARRRRQFGRRIADFQAVTHKLARIKLDIELGELMLYKVAWLHKQHRAAFFESAAIKLFTSEAYVRASLAALEIHGALGYVRRSGIERQVRDSLASPIYSGTSDIQREIIAAWIGLDAEAEGQAHAGKEDNVRAQTV